jgi:hypothetical protein
VRLRRFVSWAESVQFEDDKVVDLEFFVRAFGIEVSFLLSLCNSNGVSGFVEPILETFSEPLC